jgi:hypothetical protein
MGSPEGTAETPVVGVPSAVRCGRVSRPAHGPTWARHSKLPTDWKQANALLSEGSRFRDSESLSHFPRFSADGFIGRVLGNGNPSQAVGRVGCLQGPENPTICELPGLCSLDAWVRATEVSNGQSLARVGRFHLCRLTRLTNCGGCC